MYKLTVLILLIVIEAKNFFNALSALLDMVSLDFFAAPDEATDEAVEVSPVWDFSSWPGTRDCNINDTFL